MALRALPGVRILAPHALRSCNFILTVKLILLNPSGFALQPLFVLLVQAMLHGSQKTRLIRVEIILRQCHGKSGFRVHLEEHEERVSSSLVLYHQQLQN